MAYIPSDDEQEQQGSMNVLGPGANVAQGAQQPQEQEQNQVSSGSSTIGSGPAPSSGPKPAGSVKTKDTGSGTITNISKYIEANKPKSQEIAQAVGKVAQKRAESVGQAVQQQKDLFKQRLQEAQTRQGASVDYAQKQLTAAGEGQEIAQTDIDRFRNLSSGREQYDTTQGLDVLKAQRSAQDLQRYSKDLGRERGRQEVLQKTFSRPGEKYTTGQRQLDTLLLQTAEPQIENLQKTLRESSEAATQDIQGAQKESQQELGQLRVTGEEARKDIQERLSGGFQGVQDTIAKRGETVDNLMERIGKQQSEYDATLNDPAHKARMNTGNKFSQEEMTLLGIQEGQQLYNVNLNDVMAPLREASKGAMFSEKELTALNSYARMNGQDEQTVYMNAKANKLDDALNQSRTLLKQKLVKAAELEQNKFLNYAGGNQLRRDIMAATGMGGEYWQHNNRKGVDDKLRNNIMGKGYIYDPKIERMRPWSRNSRLDSILRTRHSPEHQKWFHDRHGLTNRKAELSQPAEALDTSLIDSSEQFNKQMEYDYGGDTLTEQMRRQQQGEYFNKHTGALASAGNKPDWMK